MEPNSEATFIPVTLIEPGAENQELVSVTTVNSAMVEQMWLRQNEEDADPNSSASVRIGQHQPVTDVHSIQIPISHTVDSGTENVVPVTAVDGSQYVVAPPMTGVQVSTQMELSSTSHHVNQSESLITVTAANRIDLVSSVTSLNGIHHIVDSSSANIYSIAPSQVTTAGNHALTSDTSIHVQQPTSVGSEDLGSHTHVVGNVVTHYLGLGLDNHHHHHHLLSSHDDQQSDLLGSSPLVIPVNDFANMTSNDTEVAVSRSDPLNDGQRNGSFLYDEQHHLVDGSVGNGHGSELASDSTGIKLEVNRLLDADPPSIDLDLEQQDNNKDFNCLVETVSCYRCKLCSCISFSKEGVEQHVRMYHQGSTKAPNKPDNHSLPSSVPTTISDDVSSHHLPDLNRRNEMDLYICSPCKRGFPDIESFTVHMTYVHHLSAADVQLEPLVLSNDASSSMQQQQQHNQLFFAPSSTSHADVVQQQQSNEAVQMGKSAAPKGRPKKKRKLKTNNENGDAKVPNILKKKRQPQRKNKKPAMTAGNRLGDVAETTNVVVFNVLDGEGAKVGNGLTEVESPPKKRRVRSKTGKATPARRKRAKAKATAENNPAIVGNRCDHNGCGVRLRSLENLDYHRKCHSQETGGFVCAECKEKYNQWKTLSAHLWRIHLIDMELFTCDLCDYKSYSYGKLMNIHRRIHSDERPYLCDVCGKGFKTSKQLRNHKVIHLDYTKQRTHRSGECDICHRYFSDKRMLRVHKDTVHNKLRPYLCNYCGYAASCRSTLKMHIRQHTGEKPFACDSCDYRTADHNSLRRHKMRHSGEKPYKCPFCVYACIQSSTYKTHLKNKHPGMDEGLMFCCEQCSFRTIKKENFVTHMVDHKNGTLLSKELPFTIIAATPKDMEQLSNADLHTVDLNIRVVLTHESVENKESTIHLIPQAHQMELSDSSVLQQQIDGVMTQAQFVFPVLQDIGQEISSQVFTVEGENHEEKFPILAGQLKLGHLSSSQATESTTTTGVPLIETSSDLQVHDTSQQLQQMGELMLKAEPHSMQDELVGEHIPKQDEEVALSHAQLTAVPPTEVILKHED